jgi:hypothetical protein
MANISEAENEARMLKGELYHAFTPELVARRKRCQQACHKLLQAYTNEEASRRELAQLWKK